MSRKPAFGRFITAMATPFKPDLSMDYDRAQEFAVDLIKRGNDALILAGSTGESSTLSKAEKLELFRVVLAAVDGEAPVIANVGSNDTAESVIIAREAAEVGVDGLMAVVPYYNKPPQEGLYRHFKAIAEAVDIPVILYNIPGRSVINMDASTTLRLANDVENIMAVKEASGKLDQITDIANNAPAGFVVYSGDDEATLPLMGLGGYGVIATIGNLAPELLNEIVVSMASGDHTKALACHLRLIPLMRELFVAPNPTMLKAALRLAGFDIGGLRLPLIDANESQIDKLEKVMQAVGVV
ncbi:MAG: 4-hydroxy-tetrahydrodipicolinate synthase [Coriobacteriales bacterium]|jgi:4-hydroxy-tetrahydrodipicolinate synthase|nr:4-hydroxy-tetrahydrodipicolinate synthase [Coriobacteriales bacterium]